MKHNPFLRAFLALAVIAGLMVPEPVAALPTVPVARILPVAAPIGAIAAGRRRTAVGSVTYDTSIGNGVNANGFTTLNLRVGAHRYFVKTSGSDANTCVQAENPATPKATIASGVTCLVDGEGDQLMLAEGNTFADALPFFPSVEGFSAAYPTAFRSYDPADPSNTAKYGRADQRNARPNVAVTATNGNGSTPYGYIAIQGLKFDPGNVAGAGGISVLGPIQYLLIENSIFAYTGLSIDGLAEGAGQHVIMRNDSAYGQWNTDGRTGGVYAGAIDYLTVEDCVIYHAGWKIGASREDSETIGGPTIFSHSFYIQLDTNHATIRRNLVMDGAADGGSMRGDTSLYTENVFIRNPISTGLGGGYQYDIHRPNGVTFEASYNLTIAGIDLQAANPRGKAFDASNGKPGSRVHHNLTIYNGVEHGTEASLIETGAGLPQPSYVDFDDNIAFHWNDSGETHAEGPLINIAYVHASHDRNKWDDPSSGTNVNSGGVTFSNPYTESSLYAAAGFANYAALVAAAIAAPEQHYPRSLRSIAFAGYGLAAPTDIVAPTLSAPVGTSTGTTTATVGATTNEGNGKLYYVVTTSSSQPHTSQIKLGLTTTGTPAPKFGSIAVSSTGAKTANLTSMAAGTYYAHLYHEDSSGNRSNTVSSSSFVIAGASAAHWDTANSVNLADIAFTNTNLTAERTNFNSFHTLVLADVGKTAGSFKATINAFPGGNYGIGFQDGLETGQLGGSSHSVMLLQTGSYWYNGYLGESGVTFTVADQMTASIDSSHIVRFQKNGVDIGITIDVSASLSTVYPAVWWGGFASVGNKVTLDPTGW